MRTRSAANRLDDGAGVPEGLLLAYLFFERGLGVVAGTAWGPEAGRRAATASGITEGCGGFGLGTG